MKKGIHPENYRPVVFKDMSNGDMFLTQSTCKTNDTVEQARRLGWSCGPLHEPLRQTEEVNTKANRIEARSDVVAYTFDRAFFV